MPHECPTEFERGHQQEACEQHARKPCAPGKVIQIRTAKQRCAAAAKRKCNKAAPLENAARGHPERNSHQHRQCHQACHAPLLFGPKACVVCKANLLRIPHFTNRTVQGLLFRHSFRRISIRLIPNVVRKLRANDTVCLFPSYLCAYGIKIPCLFL